MSKTVNLEWLNLLTIKFGNDQKIKIRETPIVILRRGETADKEEGI